MSKTVLKHPSETYYIGNNGEWGYFTITEALGLLNVNCSYGTFGFCWPSQNGPDFKNWITKDGDIDYVTTKLTWSHRLSKKAEKDFGEKLLRPFFQAVQRELKGEPLEPPQPPEEPECERSKQAALAL